MKAAECSDWKGRPDTRVFLIAFYLGWLVSCSKSVLYEPVPMKALPFCENNSSLVRLYTAAFKISPWSECNGSICKYSNRLGNIFLLSEPCEAGCLIHDGPFFTIRNLNSILIPAEIEGTRWVWDEHSEFLTYEEEQARGPRTFPREYLRKIYGKIIDTVSGRVYTERGYSQIMYLDFQNAPVVEYTKLDFDDNGIDCSE